MALRDETPLLFDRYRVDGVLGEGGQAVVLQAFDQRLAVPRALKVMLPTAARRRTQRERFVSEAQLLARIEHPNIVRVYDVDATGTVPYFVMELVTGGSLADRLRRGVLPPHLAVQVLEQLCAGLEVAHDAGVVHRDVKPQNVLIAPGGLCKLVDFGIARFEDQARTRQGIAMGTDGFMPPEQVADAGAVDRRADLLGVGMTAYVLLTGRSPVEWLGGELAGIPAPLVPVIAAATEQDRSLRPASALALAEALRAAVEQVPADPPGTTLVLPWEPRRTTDDELRTTLDEVRAWFSAPPLSSLPPVTLLPPPSPPPAPAPATRPATYQMSRPAAGSATAERPDWVAEVPVAPTGFEVQLDHQERQLSVEARTRRVQGDDPTAAEQATRTRRLGLLVAGGVVFLILIGGSVAWIRYQTQQTQRAIAVARVDLARAVAGELAVFSTLEQLGADPVPLAELLAAFEGARTDADRAQVAARIVDHLQSETTRLTEPGSAQRATLEAHLLPLRNAESAWDRVEGPRQPSR
jgi:serine/threonine-protein kinase